MRDSRDKEVITLLSQLKFTDKNNHNISRLNKNIRLITAQLEKFVKDFPKIVYMAMIYF